jgi:hypothetical protein
LNLQDPHILEAGHGPTPFTAEEIRIGCPPGRRIRLLVEEMGEDPRYRFSRFAACDREGATIEVWRTDRAGEGIGEVAMVTTTWQELQGHASFPASITEVTRDSIRTPLGTSQCLCYRIDRGDIVERFWFDVSRPGMPIRFTTEQDGSAITTVTMVEDVIEEQT